MNERELAKERKMNIDRAKMHILEPREWPKDSAPDDKLYSLECSRAMDLVSTEDGWTEVEVPAAGGTFATEKPTLTPVEGSYAFVANCAARLNKVQGQTGQVHWIYAPVLIKPQLVA